MLALAKTVVMVTQGRALCMMHVIVLTVLSYRHKTSSGQTVSAA